MDEFFQPTDPEKAMALAQALRRQRELATLGILSGDKVLSGLGQQLFNDASRQAIQAQPSPGRLRLALEAQKFNAIDPELRKRQAEADIKLKESRAGYLDRPQGRTAEDPVRQRFLELRNQKLQRDLEGTGQADPKFAMALRKEFTGLPEVKSFKDIQVSFDKISRAASNPSPAGDLSLIFAYMKLLDPGSTVREGEFATAQQAGSLPTQLVNKYNKVVEGERLAPEQRADFLRQAKSLFEAHASQYGTAATKYRGLATKGGIAPEDVADEISSPTPKPPASSGLSEEKRKRKEEILKKLKELEQGGGP